MANTYNIGETVKIVGTFKQNGVIGDPSVIRTFVKDPEGVITQKTFPDVSIVKESDGVYSFEISLSISGFWYYRMDDGGSKVGTEGYLVTRVSELIP